MLPRARFPGMRSTHGSDLLQPDGVWTAHRQLDCREGLEAGVRRLATPRSSVPGAEPEPQLGIARRVASNRETVQYDCVCGCSGMGHRLARRDWSYCRCALP